MSTKETATKRRSTFAITFYLNTSTPKKNGYCPLRGRITIDRVMAQFSTRTHVHPKRWDGKAGRATGNSRESIAVNRKMDQLTGDIKRHYDVCLDEMGYVTAEMIKNKLKGIGIKPRMLLELYREHNAEYASRIGVDRVKETMQSYMRTYRFLVDFINDEYRAGDVALKSLDQDFIERFDLYLRTEKKQAYGTMKNHITYLKKMTRRAVAQGTLLYDPYAEYRVEQSPSPFRHLSLDDMEKVMQTKIDNPELCYWRDLFVFSCFTGLAFIDLCNFSPQHLVTGSDGRLWIKMKRGKTGIECNVKLLPIPLMILEKYRAERTGEKIFKIEYKNRNIVPGYMRRLEATCGVNYITFHMSRHNFATHVTLSQGVSIASVSRMMGHKSIRTTQIYAKMMTYKLSEDMKRLAANTAGKYTLYEPQAAVSQ